MNIKLGKNKLVLEIGNTQNPHPQTNILCYPQLHPNKQAPKFRLKFDQPLLIIQGENLPFKNKSFDFIICRHTLESSKAPLVFLKEMERVSHKGLIICANAVKEKIFSEKHNWYITNEKGKLIFRRTTTHSETQDNFFQKLYAKKLFFRRFCQKHDDSLNIYIYWNKKIPAKKARNSKKFRQNLKQKEEKLLKKVNFNPVSDYLFFLNEVLQGIILKAKLAARNFKWGLIKALKKDVNIKKLKPLIVCPKCKHSFEFYKRSLKCKTCESIYQIENGVPFLLTKTGKSIPPPRLIYQPILAPYLK